ncbi:hypothetical protein HDZ31DRAFT_74690 [Schizophyllum fasciatum]
MTEYDPSPEAIEEYYSSRSRTAAWIHRLEVESLRAPSECPTRIDDVLLPSRPPSEAGSSRSVPPKMLLRFNDGRPDEPIPVSGHASVRRISRRPHEHTEDTVSRPRTLPHPPSHHSRPSIPDAFDAAWDGSPSHSRHRKRSDKSARDRTDGSRTPREDHSMHTAPRHSRSKSLPQDKELRDATRSAGRAGSSSSRALHPPPTPPMPIPPSRPSSHGHRSVVPNTQLAIVPASPWHPPSVRVASSSRHQRSSHSPPAIVYAPSHHSQANYSPPAIYSHPPSHSPRQTALSRSSPEYGMPTSHPPTTSPPMSEQGRRAKRPRKREGNPPTRPRQQRSHSVPLNPERERSRRPPRSPSRSSQTPSAHSGSTYYVIPNAGQKVHVINPDASTTIYTATSTTQRSPTSPRSLKSLKMSFFQRLISMSPKFSSRSGESKVSARSSTSTARRLTNRLLRRHSLSGGSQASS